MSVVEPHRTARTSSKLQEREWLSDANISAAAPSGRRGLAMRSPGGCPRC